MTIFFIIVAIMVLFRLGPMAHMDKIDKEQKKQFQEKVSIIVGDKDRPKPNGKHCSPHNWTWIEGTGHYCTWCKRTPRQIQESSF